MQTLFARLVTAAIALLTLGSDGGMAQADGGPPKCAPGEVDICTGECNAGRAGSCAALGYTFVDGIRCTRDPAKGAHYRKVACDLNEFNACGNLAWQYIHGVGVPMDYATARVYAEKGCRGGDGVACANLRFLWSQPQPPPPQPSLPPAPPQPVQAPPPSTPAASSTPQPPASSTPSSDAISKSLPNDAVSNLAIDTGFKEWSSTWIFDRYIPGSARAMERGFRDGTYVIRGGFAFLRGGGRLTIPFAAAFTNPGDGYRLSNLY